MSYNGLDAHPTIRAISGMTCALRLCHLDNKIAMGWLNLRTGRRDIDHHQNKTRLKIISAFVGFTILSATVLILLGATTLAAWRLSPAGGIVTLIVLIGVILAIIHEGQSIKKQILSNPELDLPTRLREFVAVFLGGILAYILSTDVRLGAVVAASLVAILAHLIFPEYDVPAYCGAFVGMTSNELLFNHQEVALASLVAGLIYALTRNVFSGFGGKLGTIALIGAVVTGLGMGRQFLITPIFDWQTNAMILLTAAIATPLTFYLNFNRKNGPVIASAVVGLIAGLIFPILFPKYGNILAVVAICASFTGMTNQQRCPVFWQIIINGILTGIIFVFSAPLFGGAGGKLGTIAFAAVLATCGYTRSFIQLRQSSPAP